MITSFPESYSETYIFTEKLSLRPGYCETQLRLSESGRCANLKPPEITRGLLMSRYAEFDAIESVERNITFKRMLYDGLKYGLVCMRPGNERDAKKYRVILTRSAEGGGRTSRL